MKSYLIGCLISGLAHAPLLRDKEYMTYAIATGLWPVPVVLGVMYLIYLGRGTLGHRKMVLGQFGAYANLTDEEYKRLLELCGYKEYAESIFKYSS